MNLNDRISKIIAYSKLSPSEFADEIDVQRSSISHITSGRNKPSLDFLIKVKDRFPELQWDWLIKNEGEMIEPKDLPKEETKTASTSLPDLFALIGDEIYGSTESEDTIKTISPQESDIPVQKEMKPEIFDSQPLANKEIPIEIQKTENQEVKIKKIVILYDNGKFESFEP
ncbi:MAG: helix-turn-helix transcriptional regulator [Bacteroidetes bacterium]|nr:helix-turn-helix transcriptional regulator [Bacteroidota bacterium]